VVVIVLNGLLLIRPEELYPDLGGLRLYLWAVVVALVWHSASVVRELSWPRLSRNPFLVLLLGTLCAIVLSQVANQLIGRGVAEGLEFLKIVAYYLILVAAITTRRHLRWFLVALVVFTAGQTTLALAQYHGYIDVAALQQIEQREFNEDEEVVARYFRLCGSGIYNDPNDLCLLLTAGMLICLSRFLTPGGLLRAAWLLPFGYFGYALTLTKSRGGLLAAAVGFGVYAVARYGGRRGLLILLLAAPVGLVVFEGRQTQVDLTSGEDTSQGRIRLWNEGLTLLPSQPVFGIGAGEYAERVGQVAHNSYVHAYVELGLFGGPLFLAAFVLALWVTARTRPAPHLPPPAARELVGVRLVILGMLASYVTGMFSLSRNYIPPTYLNLALVTIYLRLAAPAGLRWFVVDGRMLRRVVVLGLAGLVFFKLFILTFVRYD
jgi:O-antigen ligase